MSQAFKCDKCGRLNEKRVENQLSVNMNGQFIVEIKIRRPATDVEPELCTDCTRELIGQAAGISYLDVNRWHPEGQAYRIAKWLGELLKQKEIEQALSQIIQEKE